ncbi:hypothetical protein GN156_03945 [bacterium LRH843]|nr:hypothetical protein [bacterium LRH843]
MGNETNTLYTFVVGGGAATGAFLLGGIDQLIIALAIVVILDRLRMLK